MFLAGAATIVGAFLVHAWYLNVVAEDAFITFRFARHLSDGHGLVWNVGEAPVEGYTNFLWLLLGALILEIGLDVVPLSQALGVAASLVTIGYTYRFARKLLDLSREHALIPCLLLAVSGPFATWAGSGMETNLFGMFVLLGCYYLVSWARLDTRADLAVCFAMLLLATLTRPEGFIVFGLFAGVAAALSMVKPRGAVRPYALALLVYIVPFTAYFVWRYWHFGFVLPNTYYAKTGGTLFQYWRGASYTAMFASHFVAPLVPIVAALAWEGWGPDRGGRSDRSFTRLVRTDAGVHVCALTSVVFALYIVYVGGDYMAMYRFFVPVLPFVYLLVGVATHRLFSCIAGSRRKRMLATGLIAGAAVLTGLQSTPIELRLFARPWFMHGTYRGVQFERSVVARNTVIGKFFRDRKDAKDSSVALLDIGVIPYYAAMKTHSITGIVDTHIAHNAVSRVPIGRGLPGHEKVDVAHALSKRPTYIVLDTVLDVEPESSPEYPDWITEAGIGEDVLQQYRFASVLLHDPVNGETGHFTFLELKTSDGR